MDSSHGLTGAPSCVQVGQLRLERILLQSTGGITLSEQEKEIREQIVFHGRSLFERGFSPGSSGNISAKLDDGVLVTPTNSCMGRLNPERISKVDWEGRHLSGDKPSKEAFLHLLMLKERPKDGAVVHLHSTYSVAVSCLEDIDPQNVLPPFTPYYITRIGRLPLVPYHLPGDKALAKAVALLAREHHAVLLANHGPVVAAPDLAGAVYAIEELEETAKLFLLLKGQKTRHLTDEQVAELERVYPR